MWESEFWLGFDAWWRASPPHMRFLNVGVRVEVKGASPVISVKIKLRGGEAEDGRTEGRKDGRKEGEATGAWGRSWIRLQRQGPVGRKGCEGR